MATVEALNVTPGHTAHVVANLNKDKSSQCNLLIELCDWESMEKAPNLTPDPEA